jgi:hypothetical protein
MSTHRRDAGTIVIGWLVKIAVVLALLAVGAFDAISVAVAHLDASDDANNAATAAADEWHLSHDLKSTVAAAQEALGAHETVVANSLVVNNDGSIHLVLRRVATTVAMNHIGPLKKYTVVLADGNATPSTAG